MNQIAESLKWKKFSVLDDGHVCLVDVMGDDYSIVEAARVSYGTGTKHTSDDETLIRYLMRHRHTTPFEMAEIKIRVRVPMDCWRQWIRHRTANVNEYSTRYSEAIDAAQKTLPTEWRAQSKSNRQGSEGSVKHGEYLSEREAELHALSREIYESRINIHGVAREQARKDLPLSTYTEAFWKIDLHNMLHFLALRMDSHAQYEIRQYATTIAENIVKPLFPITWKAFQDYRLNSLHLTAQDIDVINKLNRSGKIPPYDINDFMSCQYESWEPLSRCRERDECWTKLIKLGLVN